MCMKAERLRCALCVMCVVAGGFFAGCADVSEGDTRERLVDVVVSDYGVERGCVEEKLAVIPGAELSVYLDILEERPVYGVVLQDSSVQAFQDATACPAAVSGPASSIP